MVIDPVLVIVLFGLLAAIILLFVILGYKAHTRMLKHLHSSGQNVIHWVFEPQEWQQFINSVGNDKKMSASPEVRISMERDNISVGSRFYNFESYESLEVFFHQGAPSKLEFKTISFAGAQVFHRMNFVVPIPRKEEQAAKEVMKHFKSRFCIRGRKATYDARINK